MILEVVIVPGVIASPKPTPTPPPTTSPSPTPTALPIPSPSPTPTPSPTVIPWECDESGDCPDRCWDCEDDNPDDYTNDCCMDVCGDYYNCAFDSSFSSPLTLEDGGCYQTAYTSNYECCDGDYLQSCSSTLLPNPTHPYYNFYSSSRDCECCSLGSTPCITLRHSFAYVSKGDGKPKEADVERVSECCDEPGSICGPKWIEDETGCHLDKVETYTVPWTFPAGGTSYTIYTATEKKECHECYIFTDGMGSRYTYLSQYCKDAGKTSCCYGECYNPDEKKCCAKDECTNEVMDLTDCCEYDVNYAPEIYYINITPHFSDKGADINYDDVFGKYPMYQCEFKVNDTNCYDEEFKVYFNITGLTWPDREKEEDYRIEGSITCGKESLCEVQIPQTHIRPADSIICKIYAQDGAGANSIKKIYIKGVPDFDIVLMDAKPIQVIEDVSLIEGRDTIVRIWYYISSSINITKVDSVYSEGEIAGQSLSGITDLKKYPPLSEIIETLDSGAYNGLKTGKNTINLLSAVTLPIGVDTPVSIKAGINPGKSIKESNYFNNNFTNYVSSKETNKTLYLVFIPLLARGWELDDIFEIMDGIDGVIAGEVPFIKEVFPMDPDYIKPIADYATFNVGEFPLEWIEGNKDIIRGGMRDFNLYANMRWDHLKGDDTFVRFIAVVPGPALTDDMGSIDGMTFLPQNTILIGTEHEEHTLIHEVGHSLGLNTYTEEYDQYPSHGKLTNDGWRISKGDAGDMINVNEEQGYFGGLPLDGYYNSEHKTVKADKPLIHSYMGVSASIYWTHSQQYNYLMNKFTKDSNGR